MIDNKFNTLKLKDRKNKIKMIIKNKAKNLSDDMVETILQNLDLEKQYTVVATMKRSILEKNSYQEKRDEEGFSYKVKIKPIVGDFTPGFVQEDGQIVPPEINDTFVAFVKVTIIKTDNEKKYQRTLFIYNE